MRVVEPPSRTKAPLLAGYNRRTTAERFDELCTADGSVRSHWLPVLDLLGSVRAVDIESRLASAQQHIRDEGITYTIYADPQGRDRPWALDELPLVLPEEEWTALSYGLAQRARLLNQIMADVYGPQKLLQEGIIPPEVIYGAGGWLPAAFGTQAPGGIFLHSYAADLLRSPDGRWWVVGDRTQAPSGAGYTLENRLIMTRAFPELLAQMPIASLTGFFTSLRESLAFHAPCGEASPRMVVLTPGPLNETYYEHSLLARYLGFPLVEGGDLVVRDGCVWLKTIAGLQRVHAILRRQDDAYCDPLELRSDSALGIAGLADCARRGTVLMANALGAGVVESVALQGFLPAACRFLLGEELALPSVATWWCGEAAAMDYVRSHLDDLVIKSVHGHSDFSPIFGQDLDATDRTALLSQIESSPDRFVAQEWVRLSQAPVLNRRPGSIQLESRSVGLRAFAVAGVQGYEVMPGGLTRVESHRDARVVSMQRGGASKDTWVLQPGNNEELSFEPKADTPYPAIHTGIPSRLAENLFWMGRYTERAEGMTRLLRQTLSERLHHARRHNITALHELTWRYGLIALPEGETRVTRVPVEQLIQCATHPHYRQGLAETLGQLGRVAFSLRDRLSHDHWRALNRLVNDQALAENMTLGPTLVWLDRAVSSLATLSGFALDAMNRDAGWRFLSLGRRMERLVLLTSALEVTVTQLQSVSTAGETQQPLEWLLDLTDSSGSFRSQTTGIASWPAVRDIVLLDSTSPRSLRFQIDGVRQALERLAQETGVTLIGLEKTSDRLNTWEAEGLPETPELQLALADQRLEIIALSDLLATRYFSVSEHAMTV
ncbi:MAG: molybdopterin oxidoreductase [Rhodocyclaceae bacterium]|nr:molybdopterin oxidoreductase [Rhodocyclaceae bacterium]